MPAKSKEERRKRSWERRRKKKKKRRRRWYSFGDRRAVHERHVNGKVAKPRDLGGSTEEDIAAMQKWHELRDRARATLTRGRPMKGPAPGAPAWRTKPKEIRMTPRDEMLKFFKEEFNPYTNGEAIAVIMTSPESWTLYMEFAEHEVDFSHSLGVYLAKLMRSGFSPGDEAVVTLDLLPRGETRTLWLADGCEPRVYVPRAGHEDLGRNDSIPAAPSVLGYDVVDKLPLVEDTGVQFCDEKLWCTECGDFFPDDRVSPCEHISWCNECHGWGGPGSNREECEHEEPISD